HRHHVGRERIGWLGPGIAGHGLRNEFGARNGTGYDSAVADDSGRHNHAGLRFGIGDAPCGLAPGVSDADQFPGSCGNRARIGDALQLAPISLGVDTPIYLSFYGTGIRGRSSLANVKVTIGTVDIEPTYAGPQPDTAGLDQVNVPLVLSLRGAGVVNVTVTVD